MLSSDITHFACKSIVVTHAVLFLIYRSSLIICLFYKVKVICNYRQNLLFGILLIFVRTVFQIVNTTLIKAEIDRSKCKVNLFKNLITSYGFIGIDFIIELYLAIKVIIIISDAKKRIFTNNNFSAENDKDLMFSTRNENIRIFNSVIFWFSIRILIAVILNIITILSTVVISNLHVTVIPTLNFFICILMSLFLTYSKDIITYLSHFQKI